MFELQTVTTPDGQQPPAAPAALQIQAPPVAQQQQPPTPPAAQQQQTLCARFCKCLFECIFYAQLTIISSLVIFLALRGLVFTKSPNFNPKKWYMPLLASVGVSGVLSLVWQCCFLCNIAVTVNATLWFTPVLVIAAGNFLWVFGQYVGNFVAEVIACLIVIIGIVLGVHGVCFVTRQRRVYTAEIMSISTGVAPARTSAIVVLSVILGVFYSGCMVAGIGGATATRSGLDILFISIIMVSLAWTMQVFKNVQEVAISKATYVYFARRELMNGCTALCVTVRHQLGSVCIGSTLFPVIGHIRGLIRGTHPREMYTTDLDCAWTLNHIVVFGNRWGFVHVGVYDKSFVQASNDTWSTFRRVAGMEELIDTDLTSSICFLSSVAIGSISALTAGIWAYLIHKKYMFQLFLYALIIGYFVGRLGSAWLQGCVMGYYVAYSEDPQSDNFDNTIPQRITRQNVEAAQREAANAVRVEEDEPDISYM